MVLEHASDHVSQLAAIGSIASKVGCTAKTLSDLLYALQLLP
jgi:hypothetical protein